MVEHITLGFVARRYVLRAVRSVKDKKLHCRIVTNGDRAAHRSKETVHRHELLELLASVMGQDRYDAAAHRAAVTSLRGIRSFDKFVSTMVGQVNSIHTRKRIGRLSYVWPHRR